MKVQYDHTDLPESLVTHCGSLSQSDPLRLSTQHSLPFPTRAAARLGELRSERYDELFFSVEIAQMRLRELASIMGVLGALDDIPPAA